MRVRGEREEFLAAYLEKENLCYKRILSRRSIIHSDSLLNILLNFRSKIVKILKLNISRVDLLQTNSRFALLVTK